MSEIDVIEFESNAEMVVDGYAFMLKPDGNIDILCLNRPTCEMIVSNNGELLETNMDAIEQVIVLNLCKKNLKFMEEIKNA